MLAFGAGHVRGALNLGAAPMPSLWAGWLLKPEQPILLVAEESRLEEIQRCFCAPAIRTLPVTWWGE